MNARFEQLTTLYLAELYATQPIMATAMGVHTYDDQLPDYSSFALADELLLSRSYLYEIDKLSLARMTRQNRIDYRLARAATQMSIFSLEQLSPYQREPALYIDTALYAIYLLLVREFAPVEDRAMTAVARMRNIPLLFLQARQNLIEPPRLFTEIAIETAQHAVAFFDVTVPEFGAELHNAALQQELQTAANDAREALRDYLLFLREDLLPRSSGDYAIGAEQFDYILRVGHLMDETGADIAQIGREALAATQEEIEALAQQIAPGSDWRDLIDECKLAHPTASDLRSTYEREMQRARHFMQTQGMLTLAHGERLQVVDTPAFARALMPFAAYMPPAPFDEVQTGYFWVTPVTEDGEEGEAHRRLGDHSNYRIPVIALHEGYPGHHAQLTRANQVSSRMRRHFANSALTAEGWALYCEELMHDLGFYTDPRIRLMQLKDQLWRCCRAIIDYELHARIMTLEQAVQLLVDEAKLEPVNAWTEVRRYATSPTQPMSYLMGKRSIVGLRARLSRKLGARFDMRTFHDTLLAQGTVPPRLLQEALLND